MTASLLTADLLALIGTRTGGQFTVRRTDFQRWAAAVGDRNPLYFDAAYARSLGHPDVVMPPLYLSHNIGVIADLNTLRPDGIPAGVDETLPLPPRRMAGGEQWEFYAHLYPDDTVEWQRELVDLTEKTGRLGSFIVITWKTRFSTPSNDHLVAVHTHNLLALPKEQM